MHNAYTQMVELKPRTLDTLDKCSVLLEWYPPWYPVLQMKFILIQPHVHSFTCL
jgi:hypothetical protein